jgi:Cu+-exporting ATPase
MDLLVALGTSAAGAVDVAVADRPPGHTPHLYFEASAVVVTLVLLGKWLEARAKRQTTAAIRALHALRPEVAHLLGRRRGGRAHGRGAGGRPPGGAPGRAHAGRRRGAGGQTQVDESMLTGEPLPVAKEPGGR